MHFKVTYMLLPVYVHLIAYCINWILMLAFLCFTLLVLSLVESQYEFAYNRDMPTYIKKALREKNMYRPRPHHKKTTIGNLTLKQVFNKIKDITRALNSNAKKNGYKVDYKFRILDIN